MSLAWQDSPFISSSSTSPPTPRSPPTASRSRKPLPFPLPDPYANNNEFELFDPRGLNLKRRESSTYSAGGGGGGGGAGVQRGNEEQLLSMSPVEHPGMGGLVQVGSMSDRVPSLSPSRRRQGDETVETSHSTGPMPIPIDHPSPPQTHEADPPVVSSPPPTTTRASGALARLNSLRIGSSSSSSFNFDALPSSSPPPSDPTSIGSFASHARQATNESITSTISSSSPFAIGDTRSRASSSASASTATSAPSRAASFLSGFGPRSRDVSLSASGRFAALVNGDEEGFHVAGYVLGKELGRGGFGVVREAIRVGSTRGTGTPHEQEEKVAVKIVRHRQPALSGAATGMGVEAPVSYVGEALKRSASGYRHPSHHRDRRMSLATEQRHRSTSTPVPAHLRTAAAAAEDQPAARPTRASQIQALTSSLSSLADHASSTLPSSLPSSSDSALDNSSSDSESAEPPSLIQALLTREIHLWAQLNPHPHIVQLITTHSSDEFTYIFMPLCEGGNLLDFLNAGGLSASEKKKQRRGRGSSVGMLASSMTLSSSIGAGVGGDVVEGQSTTRRPGLPLPLAREIFGQIVEGLHYLHNEAGVTHRDIKLDNILCDEKDAGAGGTWKIADFGLAESASSGRMLEVAKGAAAASAKATASSRSCSPAPAKPKRPRGPLSHASASSTASGGHITPGLSLASLSRANSLSRPDSCTSLSNDLPAFDSIDEHLHPAGSLPYSTPEQMRSPVPLLHPAGDVWAAGCVLYALVQGELPFHDEFEPRLRSRILRGVWEVPGNLLVSRYGGGGGGGEDTSGPGEEEQRCLEVLRGCLEVDPQRRWTIKQVRESSWLRPPPSPLHRGRALSRGHPSFPSSSSSRRPSGSTSSSRGIPPSTSSRSISLSNSDASDSHNTHSRGVVLRRKERSTSRNSAAVKHLGIDERTRSAEQRGVEREERKMRWERSRSGVRGVEGGGGASRSRSAVRREESAAGRREGSRGRSRERGVGGGAGGDAFDLREVSREAERLGRVLEPY